MLERPSLQAGFAAVNGAELYYEITGQGKPLVLVHAGIADRRMWDDQVVAFADQYQVIRYDMRGFGKSKLVPGPFRHADDLVGLMTFLRVDHAVLIGCSKGGTACIDAALAQPQLASALVLVGASPSGTPFEGERPPEWEELMRAFAQRDLARASELEVQIWVDGGSRKPDQVNPSVRDRVREMNMIALEHEAEGIGTEEDPPENAAGRLGDIPVPVLIVVGDLDNEHVLRGADEMAKQLPAAQKVVMSGTAHVPNMEQPEQFNRFVLDFLHGL